MAIKKHHLFVGVALAIAAAFTSVSMQPRYELRNELPEGFVVHQGKRTATEAEIRVARSYWDCAVTQIQYRYNYGYDLPQDPPAEFSLGVGREGEAPEDPAVRAKYWQEIRTVWFASDSWERKYGFDLTWLTKDVNEFTRWVQLRASKLDALLVRKGK